jgi:nucleotide-binding universal stress UspA family protein
MDALKSVLVATDFGEASKVALRYGRDVAHAFGATLHVLHVVDDLAAHRGEWSGAVMNLKAIQVETEEAARRQLSSLVSTEDRQTLHARTVVVTSPSPAEAILDYAGDVAADILVVGTHGRGPLGRLMMGSVAERLVRTAPCPVLTVRHPEHELVRPEPLQAVARV